MPCGSNCVAFVAIFSSHQLIDARRILIGTEGSFEIGVVAERLGKSQKNSYDVVAYSAASGVVLAGLDSRVPCIFGVLTCEDTDQALNRAGGKFGNKGTEAAMTAIQMASLFEHYLK